MSAFIGALGWTLVDFVWQGTLLALALAVALAVIGPSSRTRYLAGCAALLACIAWPAANLFARLNSAGAATTLVFDGIAGLPLLAPATPDVRSFLQEHMALIVACWAACTTGMALRMSLGLLWIARMGGADGKADFALQARLERLAAQLGVTADVRLRVVESLRSPVTAGWLRPVVLVPAALATGMPPQLLDALLAHELAHVRRMDYLVNLVQNAIEALLFYHPAVWWISKQVRNEREKIADDFAASKLGEPRRLALALSELEKIQFTHHHLAQAANGGNLMVRITRLIRPETQARSWKAAIPVLGLLLACAMQYPQPALATGKQLAAVLDFKSCAKPVYPKDALRQEATGTVSMEFSLTPEGKVSSGRVTGSSGHASLDKAALDALSQCTFSFATVNGTKVITEKANVKYVWQLN